MVRSKYRYIIVKIIFISKLKDKEASIKNSDLYKVVLSKVRKFHGDYGFAMIKTGFICKYCNEATNTIIFKVRHNSYSYISSVLPFISEISRKSVQLQTIRVTATLHQAYIHLKAYQENQLEKIWNTLPVSEQTNVRKKFGNLETIKKLLVDEKQRQFNKL